MKTKLTLAAVAAGCALALPASAHAAYELGNHPDAILEGTSMACDTGPCTIVQDESSNEPARMPEWVAAQGVIVQWRARGAGQVRLQRVAVDANGNGSALGATEPVQLDGTQQEFPASLPIRAGEAIGIELMSAGAEIDAVDLGFGESALGWEPALGATSRPGVRIDGAALALQAVIEPDVDADGLGDESQDSCVNCNTNPPPPPPPDPGPGDPPADPGPSDPPAGDVYAAIRKTGPKATLARAAVRKGRKVTVTVTNPYAFALKGKLQLKRGRKVVGKATLRLAANATRSVAVKVRKPARSLTAVVTLRAPEGPARKTTKKLKVGKPKPGKGGIDGNYKGTGAAADWVMVIRNGVVTNFNGSITTYCTKAGKQQNHTFAMIGDDPEPRVAADGSFSWEATTGYGFDKLKFDGKVSGGTVTGKMMVESRPPIQGVSPVTGMPRIEFEYCFAGREYTLTKK